VGVPWLAGQEGKVAPVCEGGQVPVRNRWSPWQGQGWMWTCG
jgi:hypothetical protein